MERGDKVLYIVQSHIGRPLRIGVIVGIHEYNHGITFLMIKGLKDKRTLSRRIENVYKFESLEQLEKDLTC